MSSTLLLLLALAAPPWDDPPAVHGGDGPQNVVEDVDARFERALQRFRIAREGLTRARADDTLLRTAWQATWLELAESGSGRAAAMALATRVGKGTPDETRALYGRLVAFAGEAWLVDPELDVFASLRRDADLLGRDRALGLAAAFRAGAADPDYESRALLLEARLHEDGRLTDPALKQTALELHRDIVERFPGTKAAVESSESLWRLERLEVGKLAPDFITRDVAGNEMRLSHIGRKVVVLDFYSFADPRTVARMAHRRALFERHREDRFVLIGINLDADPIAFRRALEEHDVEWPNSFEGGPDVRAIWKVRRGPVHYVLDQDRVIRHVGSDDAQLDAAVAALLVGNEGRAAPGSKDAKQSSRNGGRSR